MQTSISPARPNRCPDCRARLAVDATRCACGYAAAPSVPSVERADVSLVLKAERLYENYLSARVMRARKAVIDLRARRMQNARDESLLRQLRTAEKELRALEMQLVAQNTRESEAANHDIVTEPIETPPSPEAAPDVAPIVPMRFRASQSTRANNVARPAPEKTFTTSQASRANQALENSETAPKICPECETSLSPQAPQCICGYNFRLARRLPAFLSDEDIRALRGQ